MRNCPQLHVNFHNHKCYIVDKETKKTIALGVEDHGLFRLVDIGQVREHALVSKVHRTSVQFGINGMGILTWHISLSYLERIWWMDSLTSCNIFKVYAKLAKQGSSPECHFLNGKLGEHRKSFNWTWHQSLVPGIYLCLLMTIVGKCGCSFWNWNLKCLKVQKFRALVEKESEMSHYHS